MSGLEYLAADALNMPLYKKDSKIWGIDKKFFEFGPWKFSLHVEVNSDVVSKESGYFMMCTNRLWMYMTVTPQRNRLLIIDATEANISKEMIGLNYGKSIDDTIQKLGKAIKGVFEYRDEKWSEVKKKTAIDCKLV